jgi:Uma2 family endonuclease
MSVAREHLPPTDRLRYLPVVASEWTSDPFTADHLVDTPEMGRRYEIIDGALVVNPSPFHDHQRIVTRLAVLLDGLCPPDLETVAGPLDYHIDANVVQPDVLVIRRADIVDSRLAGTPLLVVEVLSVYGRRHDRLVKRSLYAEAGVPSCWYVDPRLPAVEVLELAAGEYVTAGRAEGDEPLTVTQPYPVTIIPSRLAV